MKMNFMIYLKISAICQSLNLPYIKVIEMGIAESVFKPSNILIATIQGEIIKVS